MAGKSAVSRPFTMRGNRRGSEAVAPSVWSSRAPNTGSAMPQSRRRQESAFVGFKIMEPEPGR